MVCELFRLRLFAGSAICWALVLIVVWSNIAFTNLIVQPQNFWSFVELEKKYISGQAVRAEKKKRNSPGDAGPEALALVDFLVLSVDVCR